MLVKSMIKGRPTVCSVVETEGLGGLKPAYQIVPALHTGPMEVSNSNKCWWESVGGLHQAENPWRCRGKTGCRALCQKPGDTPHLVPSSQRHKDGDSSIYNWTKTAKTIH